MTQSTQFSMSNGSALINVLAADVSTYLAAGWSIVDIRYSEAGEGVDVTSLVLMLKGADAIYVHPGDAATYLAAGYVAGKVIYGSSRITIPKAGANITFLDTPDFSSAEVGNVAATSVVATFTTEVVSSDYKLGVTIKVNTVAQTISSAARQSNHRVVHYVIPAVVNGDTVTWSYDDLTGQTLSEVDGSHLDDVTNAAVTNNVPA